jgi:hypothetical protein
MQRWGRLLEAKITVYYSKRLAYDNNQQAMFQYMATIAMMYPYVVPVIIITHAYHFSNPAAHRI